MDVVKVNINPLTEEVVVGVTKTQVQTTVITVNKGSSGARGLPGADAPNVMFEYSVDGNIWSSTPTIYDCYFRTSSDGGDTWGDAVLYKDSTITPEIIFAKYYGVENLNINIPQNCIIMRIFATINSGSPTLSITDINGSVFDAAPIGAMQEISVIPSSSGNEYNVTATVGSINLIFTQLNI